MSHRSAAILLGVCFAGVSSAQLSSDLLGQLRFRYIGPVGNRVIAAAGVPGDPLVYYAGAASGGIFKTTDGGMTWAPIFDGQPVSSVGSLAIAPSDPNIVWAGTGETFIRSHISAGMGIYKSMDAGKTWSLMGLENTGRIGRVVIDPRNPEIVLACALGHAYGPQPERGVFRTSDGGKTWQQVLAVDPNTGCSDLALDPNNSRILFAGMWQLSLSTWNRTSGGPGSGIFKSSDGGVTWTRLSGRGLPNPPVGKIGLAFARRSSRIYALIETGDGVPWDGRPTQKGQLWKSDDAGDRWDLMSVDRQLIGRAAYYTRCAVSPDNENEIYFLTAAFSRSLDGGRTLTNTAGVPGGDNHDMWIDPTNGDRIAVANDGGFSISVNRGRTWHRVQLPIAQMYHVTVDNQIPYFVYGNKQDGSSYRGPSNSLGGGGRGGFAANEEGAPGAPGAPPQAGGFGGRGATIPRGAWHEVTGGESGFATPDPVDPNIIWSSASGSGSVGGIVTVFDERNHQARNVEIWPEQTSGATAAELKYRFNWEFPIAISPHDHTRVYAGSQFLHVTTDAGQSWSVISPDLTRNDKSRMGFSGGLTGDNIGVEYAGVVFAIAESPKQAGVIWAGTNDGLVQLTRDAGKTWTNVTANIPGMPDWGTVSNIDASHFDAGTAYITVDAHQVNNRDPFIYKTTDYGKTWTAITSGIPHSMLSYAHCVRENPARKGMLFAGTENGLYISFDDGGQWQPLQSGLPHAPVYWIAVQEHFHDLAIATYGRGFWILDNLTALEQLTPEVAAAGAHLFAPRDAYRFRTAVQPESYPYDATVGQNPPYGASIDYYLKAAPQGPVRIAIVDAAGRTVRTINAGAQPGINRVWWDLRFTPTKPMRLRTSPEYAPEITVGPDGTRPAGIGGIALLAQPGINRVWWDLRFTPTRPMRLRTSPEYAPEITVGPDGTRPAGIGGIALLAPPGTYTVKLTVEGKDYTRPLKVIKDPHSNGSEGDIQIQTRLMTSLSSQMDNTVDAVNRIESLRAQLHDLELVVTDPALRDAADKLAGKLTEIEGSLIRLKVTGRGQDGVRWPPQLAEKIAYLANEVETSDYQPTTQQVAVHDELKEKGATYQQRLKLVLENDLAAFNAQLRQRNVPNLIAN